MIYIGFSTKTHKLSGQILCRHFRHCAPIIKIDNTYVLYQFTCMNKIARINIKYRDIKILELYGWEFIKYNGAISPEHALKSNCITCVQFTKCFCNINKITIQTPDALFTFLNK